MMASMRENNVHFMEGLRGTLLMDEPMSKHTSWRVGGRAQYFYTPADKSDLVQLLQQLPDDLDLHWVGLGSNLLVLDGGVAGMVIRTSRGLTEIAVQDNARLSIQSGVSSAKVARTASSSGLQGAGFLAGVPGSFGGALAMNAGAFGSETWDWVAEVECVNRKGQLRTFYRSEIQYGYRRVAVPDGYWFVGGVLQLEQAADDWVGREQIRSLLDKRSASQPIQTANAGSVFRNPQGGFAAQLIEQCGLKGTRIGGAEISTKHANFIINHGNASAADVCELIALMQSVVMSNFGIELETEVRLMGERGE